MATPLLNPHNFHIVHNTFNLVRHSTSQQSHKYQNASLVGEKQQGECLKVQWSVQTATLDVFVNSITYWLLDCCTSLKHI